MASHLSLCCDHSLATHAHVLLRSGRWHRTLTHPAVNQTSLWRMRVPGSRQGFILYFAGFLLKFKDPKIHFFTPVHLAVSDFAWPKAF